MANENLINKGKKELDTIMEEIKKLRDEFNKFKRTQDEVLKIVKEIQRDI